MIGYIFVLCALAAGLTKGYCGKKTSGVITGLRGTVLFNAIRMLICIPIGALFVLFTAKGANFDVDALTLIISAVSGVSTAMFVVTWIGCVRVGAYMMVDLPLHSAAATASLKWRSWSLLYKWCYYSERYTMSSNDIMLTGKLPEYFMNNISLEKRFSSSWADFSLKGSINNLFNEEYLSVLSRPMPGINFEIFLGITPKWGRY